MPHKNDNETENNIDLDPLKSAFITGIDSTGRFSSKSFYAHPSTKRIIADTEILLKKSKTGKELLNFARDHNIKVDIIKGPKITRYMASATQGILTLPAVQAESNPRIVLEYAALLREGEQEASGFSCPDKDENPIEYVNMAHSKNLDIVLTMCEIAYELNERLKYKEFLDELSALGHNDVYREFLKERNES
jgi:hypothetical protein